jgi:hypothetical protein
LDVGKLAGSESRNGIRILMGSRTFMAGNTKRKLLLFPTVKKQAAKLLALLIPHKGDENNEKIIVVFPSLNRNVGVCKCGGWRMGHVLILGGMHCNGIS